MQTQTSTIEIAKPKLKWGDRYLLRKDVVQMSEPLFLLETDECDHYCVVNFKSWLIVRRDGTLVRFHKSLANTLAQHIPYEKYTKETFQTSFGLSTTEHQIHFHQLRNFARKAKQIWL